jgi:7-cyano-7-deazaguanine synthase
MKKKAVILLSGGLDSTTCLAYAKSLDFDCYTLSFDYHQKHRAELLAAERIAKQFAVKKHHVFVLPIGDLGGSALTDAAIQIEDHTGSKEIPATYVPARNTIMLSLALGWAEILNADAIFIGTSFVDYSHYPDCRPEFIQAFQALANLATKRGVEGQPIRLETPLMYLSKAETIKLGHTLGVDYAQTVSCYRATHEGLACGSCDSCFLRKKGFLDANMADETKYRALD